MSLPVDQGRNLGPDALGENYPFIQPNPEILKHLVLDLYLELPYSLERSRPIQPHLALRYLAGFDTLLGSSTVSLPSLSSSQPGLEHDADLVIVDATNRVVFDSTQADRHQVRLWNDRLAIYEWHNTTSRSFCRAVISRQAAAEFGPVPLIITPTNGQLDPRTWYIAPPQITSIRVQNQPVGEVVTFQPGYNFEPVYEGQNLRQQRLTQRIVIHGHGGAGLGRYSDCGEGEPPPLLQIMGTRPDEHGDISLEGSDCFKVERVGDHALSLADRCNRCCDCSDYEHVFRALRRAHERYLGLARRYRQVREEYTRLVEAISAAAECLQQNNRRLQAVASHGGYLELITGFGNSGDAYKYAVTVTLSFTHHQGKTGEHVVSSAFTPGSGWSLVGLNGSWATWSFTWDSLAPGKAVRLRSRFKFPSTASGDVVTVSAIWSVRGHTYPALTQTVALVP